MMLRRPVGTPSQEAAYKEKNEFFQAVKKAAKLSELFDWKTSHHAAYTSFSHTGMTPEEVAKKVLSIVSE